MSATEPFNGHWQFNPDRSQLSTPPPRSWTQQIEISGDEISVREEIVAEEVVRESKPMIIEVRARFDGKEYPVTGSAAAGSIRYARRGERTIVGAGSKTGSVLQETVSVSEDGLTMTLRYSIVAGDKEIANGSAVFERG